MKAFVEAFNSGDEKTFLKAQEELMASDALARRPTADRAKMFSRMKGDFGTLTVKRAARGVADRRYAEDGPSA